eukprot:scaffold5.g813.t1
MEALGHKVADEEIAVMLAAVDGDRSGWAALRPNPPLQAALRPARRRPAQVLEQQKAMEVAAGDEADTVEAFVAMGGARDKSGAVCIERLRRTISFFGLRLDFEGFLRRADKDEDGTISYEPRLPAPRRARALTELTSRIQVVEVAKYNKDDPAAAVRVVERPVPEPGQGEVLVKVVRNGPGTKGTFQPGQRVVGTPWSTQRGNGSWQQYVAISEGLLLGVPDGMSDDVASQYFVNPVTAVGFFSALKLKRGDWLINNAATSALGRMVISLGKHHGVRTINLVRRREAVDELKQAGADEVLVLGEDDIPKRVREITGASGAPAALEPVGDSVTKDVVCATADGGTVLIYGAMQSFEAKFFIPDLLFRRAYVKLHGFWLSTFLKGLDDAARRKVYEEASRRAAERRGAARGGALLGVMDLLASGVIQAGSGDRFPLDEATDAVRATSEPGRPKVFLEG